jgi:hypothetical protein
MIATPGNESPSVRCVECGHTDPHLPPTEWEDGGCRFLYATTAKGGGIGGSAITACGCTAQATPNDHYMAQEDQS